MLKEAEQFLRDKGFEKILFINPLEGSSLKFIAEKNDLERIEGILIKHNNEIEIDCLNYLPCYVAEGIELFVKNEKYFLNQFEIDNFLFTNLRTQEFLEYKKLNEVYN